jgi:hypothetical protein
MKDLRYRPLVDAKGRFAPWINDLRHSSGAYVIRRAAGANTVLYVGESHTGRLAKTIKRHFHRWHDDPERKHHTYSAGAVEIAIRITPPNSAAGAQDNLIARLAPRDNGTSTG